ncbi:hypothetical protein MHYP_G00178840 [Metynnis hypsauchen]
METQEDENQLNALIYAMGEEAEDILTSLHLSPAEASEFCTVRNKLDAHFITRRNVIFERAKFNQRVKEELNRMEQQGVISKVEQPTEWCVPMVVVPK